MLWEVLVLQEVDLWSAAGRAETRGAANKPKLSKERIDILKRMWCNEGIADSCLMMGVTEMSAYIYIYFFYRDLSCLWTAG